jgi:predicted metalloprotease with PDZ domain
MRALRDRYLATPERGVTEEEFIAIVSGAVGVDCGEVLRGWLDSTEELPIAESLARFGLAWRPRVKSSEPGTFGEGRRCQEMAGEDWTGMKLEDAKNGVRVVRVMRDSPAEAAGFGLDDEIIAVDGYRITSARQFDAHLRGSWKSRPVSVTAASEGKLYQTKLDTAPHAAYELVEREEMTTEERARLDRWLKRG